MVRRGTSMSSFVEFKKVSVIRDARKILDDISLKINSDENVVIIGPNGSGKSAFIKLLTGRFYPSYTGGDTVCRLFGFERWNIHDLRSMLGIVTDELQYSFHNKITGFEAVLSGFFSSIGMFNNHIVTKEMTKIAADIIEFMEVSCLRHKKLETMSSGEARRFLIARALANNPKVLILDEPSNGLDIASSVKLYNTMRKILSYGTKIILVTHLVSDIIPEMNRFIFFKNGKIFADGKRAEVFNSDKLSSLFELKVKLYENNGLCSVTVV
ncbi:MAG: ATP-binding cassette domain-containing protein [Endomicrobium sp.]|jgi:iron complex transport system ATP-binding protein|nr:ATP-binding cassette domain-containing protein [Endomicrobium sp.]